MIEPDTYYPTACVTECRCVNRFFLRMNQGAYGFNYDPLDTNTVCRTIFSDQPKAEMKLN